VNRRAFVTLAAAAPFALATAPARRRPLALVTADLESQVVVFDLAAGRVVGRIPTLPGPKSIEAVAGGALALVAHTKEGAVSIVDVARMRVRHVLRDFVEPRYTAALPDDETAVVTDAGSGEIVVVDLFGGRIVHRLAVGSHTRHVSLEPRSLTLWTALGFSAPEIVAVDLGGQRPRVAVRIAPPFPAHDVVFAPGGGRVWVSSGTERRLAVYDTTRRRVLFELDAGQAPQHIAFSRTAAFVTSDDAVRVHALRDGRLLHETAVPAGSYNVTHDGIRTVTPSLERGTLTVLDARGRVVARPTLARAAHDACLVAGR
jgi:DNA-binding beta-propeller fold protein YncE